MTLILLGRIVLYSLYADVMRGCEIVAWIQAETNKIHWGPLVYNILGVNLDPSAIRINIKVISPQKEERGVGKMSELKWMSSGVRDKSWTIMFQVSLLLIITQSPAAVASSGARVFSHKLRSSQICEI